MSDEPVGLGVVGCGFTGEMAVKNCLPRPHYFGPEGASENYFSGLVGFADDMTIQIDCSNVDQSRSPIVFALYGTTGTITGDDPMHAASTGGDKAIFRFESGGDVIREEIDEAVEVPYTNPPEGEFFSTTSSSISPWPSPARSSRTFPQRKPTFL